MTAANMAVPKSPFCSLSAALRKLLHPHLRIHAKSKPSARPLSAHPSVHTISPSLSSPIIAPGASLHRCIFSPAPLFNAVSIPRVQVAPQRKLRLETRLERVSIQDWSCEYNINRQIQLNHPSRVSKNSIRRNSKREGGNWPPPVQRQSCSFLYIHIYVCVYTHTRQDRLFLRPV